MGGGVIIAGAVAVLLAGLAIAWRAARAERASRPLPPCPWPMVDDTVDRLRRAGAL